MIAITVYNSIDIHVHVLINNIQVVVVENKNDSNDMQVKNKLNALILNF